jgi:hypothetical protein
MSIQCPDYCSACALKGPRIEGNVDWISELLHGDGLPFKVLLTIFRWARPFSQHSWEDPLWGMTNLSTSDFVTETIDTSQRYSGRKHEELWEPGWQKNARNAVRFLVEKGLILEVRRGRGAQTYIPHRMAVSAARIPNTIWKNGWLRSLGGTELYLLVSLLSQVSEESDYAVPATRLSRLESLPLRRRRVFSALSKLKEKQLIAQVHRRSSDYVVLLDPDVLRNATPTPM